MDENMWTIIMLFGMSAFAIIVSIFSFMEKGIPFNNAYLFATKEERTKLDKKQIYRQTAIVFGLIGLMLLISALLILFNKTELITPIIIPFCIITVVYAIISSINMN